MARFGFYEFFAGGGMARLGLGSDWECLFANDIDPKKVETYASNFGRKGLHQGDIYDVSISQLPGKADLAWASFPCQDLSLAGNRNGLAGERSGTFWGFWNIINKLKIDGRAPPILVLENVCGALTSNRGQDFVEICSALASLKYCYGAVVIDAVHFVPQSRPRLFIVCVEQTQRIPASLLSEGPIGPWQAGSVQSAASNLPSHLASKWRWWRLPPPPTRSMTLDDVVEEDTGRLSWHSKDETQKLLALMSPANRKKIVEAQSSLWRSVGTIYKRTRIEDGQRKQRAEVRFDGIAGCLRTPGGGSSRQTIIIVEGKQIRTRLLTVREAARLMGVPDSYAIPSNYNDGYHVFGDGLAVPAVKFIRQNLLNPLAATWVERARSFA